MVLSLQNKCSQLIYAGINSILTTDQYTTHLALYWLTGNHVRMVSPC